MLGIGAPVLSTSPPHTFQSSPLSFLLISSEMLHPNGFPASLFHPLCFTPDGSLLLSWSPLDTAEPAWELRLELLTSCDEKWGYLSLIRTSTRVPLPWTSMFSPKCSGTRFPMRSSELVRDWRFPWPSSRKFPKRVTWLRRAGERSAAFSRS